jgi:hypothetical protein
MNSTDERRFKLLLDIARVLSTIFTFSAGVAASFGHSSSRVLAGLLVLAVTSWFVLIVLLVGRHSAEKAAAETGESRTDAPGRSRFLVAAVTTGAILVAGLGGLLIGHEVSSRLDSDRAAGSPAYARSLEQVFGRLRATRAVAFEVLDHRSGPIAKGRAATRLGEAFVTAASSLEAARPRRAAEVGMRRRITVRTRALGEAYLDLGSALADRGGSQTDLDRARLHVDTASHRLSHAVRGLEDHGYRIVSWVKMG